MAQSAILVALPQTYHPNQPIGPLDQFLSVMGRARQQLVQRFGGADKSVAQALGSRQLLVKQALAHTERGKNDRVRLCDTDDVFEHERRIGQQRPPRVGN